MVIRVFKNLIAISLASNRGIQTEIIIYRQTVILTWN